MSVNKEKPHLLVLPEDDANRQLANGFHKSCDHIRQMQVLPVAGGWRKVLEEFQSVHVYDLMKYPGRLIVLLIDFDNHLQERQADIEAILHQAPPTVRDRVFILGTLTEPEELRNRLAKALEDIGVALAGECRTGESLTWSHPLLSHNKAELDRLRAHASILFDATGKTPS